MVSIMASPTKSVRGILFAASGWRAIASIAAVLARPSANAGPSLEQARHSSRYDADQS